MMVIRTDGKVVDGLWQDRLGMASGRPTEDVREGLQIAGGMETTHSKIDKQEQSEISGLRQGFT